MTGSKADPTQQTAMNSRRQENKAEAVSREGRRAREAK